MNHRKEVIVNLSIYKSIFSVIPRDIIILILDYVSVRYKYTYALYNSLELYYAISDYFFVTCVEFSRYDLLDKYLPKKYHLYEENSFETNLYIVAIVYNNINMIKYLKRKKVGYMNKYVSLVAGYFGYLNILKLLKEYGCPFSGDLYYFSLCNRQYDICKYLNWSKDRITYPEISQIMYLRNRIDKLRSRY